VALAATAGICGTGAALPGAVGPNSRRFCFGVVIENPRVGGSIPSLDTSEVIEFFGRLGLFAWATAHSATNFFEGP
jgi:hypothetical protein